MRRQVLAAERTRLAQLVALLNKVRLTTRRGDA